VLLAAAMLAAVQAVTAAPAPPAAGLATSPRSQAAPGKASAAAVPAATLPVGGWAAAFEIAPREREFTVLLRGPRPASLVLVSPAGQRFAQDNGFAIGRWFVDGEYVEVTVDAAVPGRWSVVGGEALLLGRIGFTVDKPPKALPAGQAASLRARLSGAVMPAALAARTVVRAALRDGRDGRDTRPLAVTVDGDGFAIEVPAAIAPGVHALSLAATAPSFARAFEFALNVVEPAHLRAAADAGAMTVVVEPVAGLAIDHLAADAVYQGAGGTPMPLVAQAAGAGFAFRLPRSAVIDAGSDAGTDVVVTVSGSAGSLPFRYRMPALHVVFGPRVPAMPLAADGDTGTVAAAVPAGAGTAPAAAHAAAVTGAGDPSPGAGATASGGAVVAAVAAIGAGIAAAVAWLAWTLLALRRERGGDGALGEAIAALAARLQGTPVVQAPAAA
jgi:hypothetical protein